MVSEVVLSAERLATHFARIGSFVRMCAFMDQQVVRFSEMTSTKPTDELFLWPVEKQQFHWLQCFPFVAKDWVGQCVSRPWTMWDPSFNVANKLHFVLFFQTKTVKNNVNLDETLAFPLLAAYAGKRPQNGWTKAVGPLENKKGENYFFEAKPTLELWPDINGLCLLECDHTGNRLKICIYVP